MKTRIYMKMRRLPLACAMLGLALLTSCEQELEPYSHSDAYLNFRFFNAAGKEMSNEDIAANTTVIDDPLLYSFKTHGNVQSDTLWILAKTVGFVTDSDREYSLEQLMVDGADNAVPGTDYVAFDSPEAKRIQVVKAGESLFRVPIVMLRNSGLSKKDAVLKVRFKANDNFKNGFTMMQTRVITFTDRLSKPTAWDGCNLNLIFGAYGDVKFQLMLDWSGLSWSDEFITEMYNTDKAYFDYLAKVFANRLAEENAKRQANGQDVYREENGTAVVFAPALPGR
ncbi:MAG: DUF4843 domain-containing protein [Prevotella sp.]|nr:DUF4843 domain-containing protein [Prevotella sp.]MBR1463377.1 DUF4843 domain-containing protein [Prevotella sp.]